MKKHLAFIALLFFCAQTASAQIADIDSCEVQNKILDSIYIAEVEDVKGGAKVLHAEPLFIDLIRDLGARKGEREWNVGVGMTDVKGYDNYTALVEYEFAPIDRLGLEVELPFSFYFPVDSGQSKTQIPGNRLNSIKLAAQYSFFVSEKRSTSAAVGYIHEFEKTSFDKYGKENLFKGNVYNPFFIAAKRWGSNFHTLLYTGPFIEHHFNNGNIHTTWQINSNIHYMISGTRNFVGIEFNKEVRNSQFEMIVRPQMRVGLSENLLIGIVTGVPTNRNTERLSMFLRLIYEPKHRHVALKTGTCALESVSENIL